MLKLAFKLKQTGALNCAYINTALSAMHCALLALNADNAL